MKFQVLSLSISFIVCFCNIYADTLTSQELMRMAENELNKTCSDDLKYTCYSMNSSDLN